MCATSILSWMSTLTAWWCPNAIPLIGGLCLPFRGAFWVSVHYQLSPEWALPTLCQPFVSMEYFIATCFPDPLPKPRKTLKSWTWDVSSLWLGVTFWLSTACLFFALKRNKETTSYISCLLSYLFGAVPQSFLRGSGPGIALKKIPK